MKKKIEKGSIEWQEQQIKPFESKDDLKDLEKEQYREEEEKD